MRAGDLLLAVSLGVFAGWGDAAPRTASAGWFSADGALPGPWTSFDDTSTASIDHTAWAEILAAHVTQGHDGVNRFSYGTVRDDERQTLAAYISQMSDIPIGTYSRAEQIAYWANLYNALTVDIVIDHYPVASIRDIDLSPGPLPGGPWRSPVITIAGIELSLNDIEHRIMRPIFADPRLHYAVNCASIGCPNLQPIPFAAATLDTTLDRAARAFVNSPRGATVDGDGLLTVSSIYVWFKEDFGNSDRGIIDHLRRYAGPGLAERLVPINTIARHTYDWRLNDGTHVER